MPDRPTALITGASGGIGEALARQLAGRNHDVILVARSEGKLQALAAELARAHSITATVRTADLSVPGAGFALAAALNGASIDVLVNNAGFADFGEFWKADATKTMQMVSLNIGALTELTHALLPAMVVRGTGRVLNVASTAAFMPGPLMSVYYASKAYVLSFSEGIHEELKGTGVTVTALCPGPTETGFQNRAAMEESKLFKGRKIMDATKVAELGVKAMLAGKALIVTGAKNKFQALTPKFFPRRIIPGFVKRAQAAH
jgi:uncharacterized protein